MAAAIMLDQGLAPPKKGEQYRCSSCGMGLEITVDCKCKGDDHVHFHCCGKEMVKAV